MFFIEAPKTTSYSKAVISYIQFLNTHIKKSVRYFYTITSKESLLIKSPNSLSNQLDHHPGPKISITRRRPTKPIALIVVIDAFELAPCLVLRGGGARQRQQRRQWAQVPPRKLVVAGRRNLQWFARSRRVRTPSPPGREERTSSTHFHAVEHAT